MNTTTTVCPPRTATALLFNLRKRGFRLRVEGDRIMVWPADKVTAADKRRILSHRDALLALLRAEAPPHDPLRAAILKEAGRTCGLAEHVERLAGDQRLGPYDLSEVLTALVEANGKLGGIVGRGEMACEEHDAEADYQRQQQRRATP